MNNSENKKVNPFKYFLKYLSNVLYDFRTSFKYNNMKLAGLLIAVPGVFLGFFLGWHGDVVGKLSYDGKSYFDEEFNIINPGSLLKPFDFSGVVLFLMILFGILNIFTAVSVSSKKNLGSVVLATITTSLVVICGALYIFCVFYYLTLVDAGKVEPSADAVISQFSIIMSVLSVVLAMLASIVGIVIAFIRYDRTYEKVDR